MLWSRTAGSFVSSDTHILIAKETFQSCKMGIVQPGNVRTVYEGLEPLVKPHEVDTVIVKAAELFSSLLGCHTG